MGSAGNKAGAAEEADYQSYFVPPSPSTTSLIALAVSHL
jgi:hypothetical protein